MKRKAKSVIREHRDFNDDERNCGNPIINL